MSAAHLQVKKHHARVPSRWHALHSIAITSLFLATFLMGAVWLYSRDAGNTPVATPPAVDPDTVGEIPVALNQDLPTPPAASSPARPAVKPPAAKPAPRSDVDEVAQRLARRNEQQLVRELTGVPELLVKEDTELAWAAHRRGLPKDRGHILDKHEAESVASLARWLRQGTVGLNQDRLDRLAEIGTTVDAATICRTMTQVLQVEQSTSRKFLVESLDGQLTSGSATELLVERALFDPSSELRAQAVAALQKRPADKYRQLLLDGFRHPWAPVGDHAAQALVTLHDSNSVPALKKLLNASDPARPVFNAATSTHEVRELVKVNHLCGCLLCHVPSTSADEALRSPIPVPGEPLPVEYYRTRDTRFQFADASTILVRQDFSMMENGVNRAPWPSRQRFDYLVRTRPATKAELASVQEMPTSTYPQQQAVRYALFHLTGSVPPPPSKESSAIELPRSR